VAANGEILSDRAAFEAQFRTWSDQVRAGRRVHCGEFGSYCRTPHAVALAWADDLLGILGDARIGWALWNFCGSFGILNSGREDVSYADWFGQRLDRDYLRLLQSHT
jgi:aryl-phospho-beta-D-glucosidase BglC (GH1 family)